MQISIVIMSIKYLLDVSDANKPRKILAIYVNTQTICKIAYSNYCFSFINSTFLVDFVDILVQNHLK